MDRHIVKLIGGDEGETATITESVDHIVRLCTLTCEYRGKTIRASARDFFEALCRIRSVLEEEGLIPYCYGASLNVYPSGMARDMGAGLSAYRLDDEPLSMESLVDIFDEGPDIIPSYVAAQKEYFQAWLGGKV